MPKEYSARQFRKGTKSCIECRRRKLRCIFEDESKHICRNCEARGRECVLQVLAGRNGESTGVTSRDRIGHLEQSVSSLWTVVRELRKEVGHSPNEGAQSDEVPVEQSTADGESEVSDNEPMNPPPHLQQLFDNEFLDSRGVDGLSSEASTDKASDAAIARARRRLQALLPSEDDLRAISEPAVRWMHLYNSMFPTMTSCTSGDEMLAQHHAMQDAAANPMNIAALLISIAITLVQRPSDALPRLSGIKDSTKYVRQLSEAVEETIVHNDDLAGTITGIETTLLYIRLQLVSTHFRKLWLMLRRVTAFAELIGLPRAAQRADSTNDQSLLANDCSGYWTKVNSAAATWKSICAIDRVVGVMFNLPVGTKAYGFPAPLTVMSAQGQVIPGEYNSYLAIIGSKVQEIDDAYISQRPETELIEKVFKAEQELRSLSGMTPGNWWILDSKSPLTDHVLQYWYHYMVVRTHLQLALRNGSDSQYMYSFLACSQAARAMAVRYVTLRNLLPPGFFAGRVLDLQALTGAVFLLYNSQTVTAKQSLETLSANDQPPQELVREMVRTMRSVSDQANGGFARQAVAAICALEELLNRPGQSSSHNLSLRIPMLGKINVNRHLKTAQNAAAALTAKHAAGGPTQSTMAPPTQHPSWQAPQVHEQPTDYGASAIESNDLLSWSMDLMMDDFQSFPDVGFGNDPWLSFNDFGST
ncbi:hypothetical protein LTR37_010005 [Vermiconidia calcicola]|uniref:Uncharacterized protein n=1 Tax=Vermiconidia calcicola TaxID=1690605 RepID=A0ACC3N6K8_9PEZI|nr:hypothetical protein LTR37_010005 [Vermiconidia calcicola]